MVILVLGLWAAGATATELYEQPTERRAAEVLPLAMVVTPNYQVQDPVVADGYMDRFTVVSRFGTFEVTGHGALRKLLHEIGAIDTLREIKTSKAFGEAVVNTAKGPLRFAKNLITHPVDTVMGIPKGAYKFMEEEAMGVTSAHNPSDDPACMQALQVSGRKREYAAQLGIDVYIMRGYHETVAPLTELQMVGRLVVAQAQNGTALLALPLDHLLWTPAADRCSQELKASYKAPGFTGQFDVWLTGTVSPLARQQLTERGMSVTEEVYKRVEIID